MAVPSDRNKIVKVFEKLSKCKDLEIKIAKMWKTGTCTTPVVIGALRVIKKGLKKCVENITGTVSIGYLQIINLLGAADILRNVLSITRTLWQPKPKVWTQCIRDQASQGLQIIVIMMTIILIITIIIIIFQFSSFYLLL